MKTGSRWLAVAAMTGLCATAGCGGTDLPVVGSFGGASDDASVAPDAAAPDAESPAIERRGATSMLTVRTRFEFPERDASVATDARLADAGAADVPADRAPATPDASPRDVADAGMVDASRPDVAADVSVDVRSVVDAGSPVDVAVLPDVRVVPDVMAVPDVMVVPDVMAARDVMVAPVDAGAPVDVATVDVAAAPDGSVVVPAGWDAATVAHVREVRDRGIAAGNRVTVFAKIGDSITESGSFLSDVGYGWATLGAYGSLDATIRYFQATALGDRNSFNRASVSATAGWTTNDALDSDGGSAPLVRELSETRPSWAIVMYGTNDIDRNTVEAYAANLGRIADLCESVGTVPVFSTVPDRYDDAVAASRVPIFNNAVRTLTATRHLPLIDYWAALQALPNHGVSDDGIHPNVYITTDTQPADFTPAGLRYGYNMRNLTALQMLDQLRALP